MTTTSTDYSFSIRSRLPLGRAEEEVRKALAKEGFGVLTEIDIRRAFAEKLGRDFRPYKILGACNPSLAHEALTTEPELGTLLPYNVVLYQDGDEVVISAMDPEAVLALVRHPKVEAIGADVRQRLSRVLAEVAKRRSGE